MEAATTHPTYTGYCRTRLDRIETLKRREKPEGLAASAGLSMGAKKVRMGDTLKVLHQAAGASDSSDDGDDDALMALDWRAKKVTNKPV